MHPICIESVTPGVVAVSLATSTLVRLLPENWYFHNRKYLVLCVDGLSAARAIVFGRRGIVDSHRGMTVFSWFVSGELAVGWWTGNRSRSLMHQNFISLALLLATTLVAGFFAYIYSIKRQTYLLLWTAGWSVFGLHYLGQALSQGSRRARSKTRWIIGCTRSPACFFF